MGLARRRKFLGFSQETFAEAVGVNRTTVARWESGKYEPQPPLRQKLAAVLQVDLHELDALVVQARGSRQAPPATSSLVSHTPLDSDDMIRREFLRAIAVSGALPSPSSDTAEMFDATGARGSAADFLCMNIHLWHVYRRARTKTAVRPVVCEQLNALTHAVHHRSGSDVPVLCGAAGDLFQLAGELAFDSNRYADAAASYALAASASKEARAFDLWACALVRYAYVDLHERRFGRATDLLSAAERIANRGDRSLPTRFWIASVQAQAHAGAGDVPACERALEAAENVSQLPEPNHRDDWLRFDGSRLPEERGACYVKLGHLGPAEEALHTAMNRNSGKLATSQSYRRQGAVLTDLAAIGVGRRDSEQVIAYGRQALSLARESSSGYVARKLWALRAAFGPLPPHGGVAELARDIDALGKTT
ncbi:helix-turn-helix domain-containing protein [Streptomyces sp. NPDC003077]|uniref:helix-turn-helix domain-containing protein n=1 Tax=Streptomyces sp. NPDC003077 TaxID=3154443 RepID=UPI0033BA4591